MGLADFLLIVFLCFTLAGEILCEMFLARTMGNVWLIHSDLARFMPMMITRMFISLRKVASSQRRRLDLEVPAGSPTHLQDGYSPRAVNIIPLPVLKRER